MALKTDLFFQQFELLGKQWVKGYDITEIQYKAGKKFTFNKKQIEFFNARQKDNLISGGYGAGKTIPLLAKCIFFCLAWPENRVLLGRKTLSDIERATLPDLFEMMPDSWYNHRVKDAVINFKNKSQIILFGLDALQSGSEGDIKKAQQKIKSLNLGAAFIDQLEEVDEEVYRSIKSRLRRMNCPVRQINSTTNPANFWAYNYFKKKPQVGTKLIETSMFDNKANLPPDYIEDQLNNDEMYVRRFVYGEWSPDVLTDQIVFGNDYIQRFELLKREPLREHEGCQIYVEPDFKRSYQMGVDPSEGVNDPASISVVNDLGQKVACFNGLVPIHALGEKVNLLYEMYHQPLIIPEVNGSGMALLEYIRDLNIYQRTVFDHRTKEKLKKIGWKTTQSSKVMLISHFKSLLKSGFVKLYDESTIEEFKTFVWSDTARMKGAGAQRGYHDDDVMSTLLAYFEIKQTLEKETKMKSILSQMFQKRRRIQRQKNCI